MPYNHVQHHLLQVRTVVFGIPVGDFYGLCVLLSRILAMWVKIAAIQVVETVFDTEHLQRMPCHLGKDFRHPCFVELIQSTPQGVVVEIFRFQPRLDQQVYRLVVKILLVR